MTAIEWSLGGLPVRRQNLHERRTVCMSAGSGPRPPERIYLDGGVTAVILHQGVIKKWREMMQECERLGTCAFFREYESNESKKLALKGLIHLYCKGDRMVDCIRMKVSKALGGPQHVPVNMMPNGQPLSGTDMIDWSDDVRRAMK